MNFFLKGEVYCIACLITTAPQDLASTTSLAFATSIPPKDPRPIPMEVRYILKYIFQLNFDRSSVEYAPFPGLSFEKFTDMVFHILCSVFHDPYSIFRLPQSIFGIPNSVFQIRYTMVRIPYSLFCALKRAHPILCKGLNEIIQRFE